MSKELHATVQHLAQEFANEVVRAIGAMQLDDLVSVYDRAGSAKASRPQIVSQPAELGATLAKKKKGSGGRPPRRSEEDILRLATAIQTLLKEHPEGLRAETIRQELGLVRKEMPRAIKLGLEKKLFTSRGEKRATTYFAGKAAAAPKAKKASAKSAKASSSKKHVKTEGKTEGKTDKKNKVAKPTKAAAQAQAKTANGKPSDEIEALS